MVFTKTEQLQFLINYWWLSCGDSTWLETLKITNKNIFQNHLWSVNDTQIITLSLPLHHFSQLSPALMAKKSVHI